MTRFNPAPSDGRMFTSYVSSGQAEDLLRRKVGARTENAYRAYLQHNAARVAEMLRRVTVAPIIAPRAF